MGTGDPLQKAYTPAGSPGGASIVGFFIDLYRYRGYLYTSAVRNLRVRYRNSLLGYFWSVLNPLLMMLILTAVFSHVLRLNMQDYAVFLLSALLAWNFFSATVMQSMTSVRRAVPVMKKLPVPKQLFVMDVVLSNLVIYVLSLIPLIAIMLALGRPVTWALLLFPLHVLPLVLITASVSTLCAIGCLFFDDINHIVEVGLRGLYFLTPILYGAEHLPPWLLDWIVLNPLFSVVEALRQIFYHGSTPPLDVLVQNLIIGGVMLVVSAWVYTHVERRVTYVV